MDKTLFDAKMLESRIVFLTGEINSDNANYVVMQLLMLDSINHDDIHLYINSPGGSVSDGLAIIDTMNHIKSDVVTIAIGTAASMAAVILSAGAKGKRLALENTNILIHQIMGGVQGQAADIEIAYKHIADLKDRLLDILVKNTGNKKEKIKEDSDRDYWLNTKEAIKYGLIDAMAS